jgi:hypothetical protein
MPAPISPAYPGAAAEERAHQRQSKKLWKSLMAINAERRINPRVAPHVDRLWLAKFLADLLDQRFTIPGTSIRIGLDPIVSLIPGIGDLLANLTGSLILLIAAQLGVPKIALARMGINVGINTILGAVPIFGDIISIWYRSNVRNVELLERYLARRSKRVELSDWLFVIGLIVGLLVLMGALVVVGIWLFKQLWSVL